MSCDCYDEGRDAFRREPRAYETQQRLQEARYGGDECDREFAEGYRREERREAERREEERREEEEAERRHYERCADEEREQHLYWEQQAEQAGEV